MQIKSIVHKEYHDAIFGGLDNDPNVKPKLANPPEFIKDLVGFRQSNAYMNRLGYRVASIMVRYREVVRKLLDEGDNPHKDSGWADIMYRMEACPPAGVITDKDRNNYRCRKYALCPFCRFHKAVEIGTKLESRLHGARWIAAVKISQPYPVSHLDNDPKKSYETLIKAICKKRKLFMYDHVVTVPNWTMVKGGSPVFSIDTTIIGLVKKERGKNLTIADVGLPLPENCLSKNARKDTWFFGADGWRVMKAEPKSVHKLMGCAMACTPSLLTDKIYDEEYVEAMLLQEKYKAVAHGK